MEDHHWADKIASDLIEKYPSKDTYVCAAGITPSGPVHIGNFRDIITSDFVVRALKKKGKKAKLLFFWDDYDRLRKIPEGVPEDFSKYLGMPISEIPDPFGNAGSYANHFKKDFEAVMPELGIDLEFINQSEEYKKNVYHRGIRYALQNRLSIAKILSEYKSQGMTKEELENFYPFQVYCRECGKDSTKITDYDENNLVTYKCKCGHIEQADISKENIGKLVWKVDWPTRWKKWGVVFEPGGRDHATHGGSFTVSSRLSEEVLKNEPPMFQGYDFVGIKGVAKMSSSTGTGITPKALLQIYEPSMLRYFFAKYKPLSQITLHFDSDLIRQYDEFDKVVAANYGNELNEYDKRVLELSNPDPKVPFEKVRVPFRQVASFGQIAQGNIGILEKMFDQAGENYEQRGLKLRLEKSQNWIEKFAPEYKITVNKSPNRDFYHQLDDNEKAQLAKLKDNLDENWTKDGLTYLVYDIPKKPEFTDKEKKKAQRDFFKVVYQAFIGKDTGPRLPTFMLALGKDKVKKLLTFDSQ